MIQGKRGGDKGEEGRRRNQGRKRKGEEMEGREAEWRQRKKK